MSKLQNRFPKLVVARSSNKKSRQATPGLRWWGPERAAARTSTVSSQEKEKSSHFPSQVIRMAVMPTLSRNLWGAGIAWAWKFVRSYFVNPRPAGAVVIAFRRGAGRQADFLSKKPSVGVGWPGKCDVPSREGGRA